MHFNSTLSSLVRFFTSTSVRSFNLVRKLKLDELVCQYRNKYFSAIV